MEAIIVSAIATEVLKNLLSSGGESLGGQLANKLRRSSKASDCLKDYLERLTNRVSYFVAYRPSPQFINDVYVQPLILDTALSLTYIEPELFKNLWPGLISGRYSDLDPHLRLTYVTPDELATNASGLLVLGEAGAGKTTFLSYLCLNRLKAPKPRLPIFVDSKDLETKTIRELISEVLRLLGLEDKNISWLNQSLTIYVDGLDELLFTRYKEVCAELGEIKQETPTIQITAACRSSAYQGDLAFLKEVTLLPFTRERTEEFIRRWFIGINNGPSAEGLIHQINKSDRLAEVSSQPLLLVLMCNAFRRYLNVSRRQSAMFDQCINSLLWQWDADRVVVRVAKFRDLDLEKKKWLHANLAVNFHNRRRRYCDKRFIVDLLKEELPRFGIPSTDAEVILSELCAHYGILVKWTEDTYGFSHLALQEFLAAKWYANERRWENLISPSILISQWWENVVALCFASLSDATAGMERVWNHTDLSELDKLKILAHSLRLDPIVDANFRRDLLTRILYLYHNTKSAEEYDAVLLMLVGIEDDWSAPIIRRSLGGMLPTRDLAKLLMRTTRKYL
ncbi:MAG TPA: NACHT domain-containing protein [Ardenticatenaceae bacterium]|jgi:predicted NACHT family NTPase